MRVASGSVSYLRVHGPGLASIGDFAVALDVLTALNAEHDVDGIAGPLHVEDARVAPPRTTSGAGLAVAEYDGAPLVIGATITGALRSWQLDGTPGPRYTLRRRIAA